MHAFWVAVLVVVPCLVGFYVVAVWPVRLKLAELENRVDRLAAIPVRRSQR